MFDKKGLNALKKYQDELSKLGVSSPTDFYLRELSFQPGLLTVSLHGGFLKEEWGSFTLVERRFITHLYEQYYVWRHFLLNIRKKNKKSAVITPLQKEVIESEWDADEFFSYLVEEIITLEQISEGLDIVKDFKQAQPADSFEASCYFFLLAYHFLKGEDTRDEYQNALCEALEHQGEFRGWAAAMLYKYDLYSKFERKDKDLGPFKAFAYMLLEERFFSPSGELFKTDTEVQLRLNDELIKYNQKEIKIDRDDFLGSIKNWYDAKDGIFKTLIKRLVHKQQPPM